MTKKILATNYVTTIEGIKFPKIHIGPAEFTNPIISVFVDAIARGGRNSKIP